MHGKHTHTHTRTATPQANVTARDHWPHHHASLSTPVMWLQKKLEATRARNSATKARTEGRDSAAARYTQLHTKLVAWAWQQVDSADAAEGGKVVEQSLMEIPSTTAAIRGMCDILDRKAFTACAAQVRVGMGGFDWVDGSVY